jgi:hypothetical protein
MVTQDTHLTVVFLHQVIAGQPFYCTPSEKRTWIRLRSADQVYGPTTEVPVQRGCLSMHMNGMVQVWVRAEDAHR